MMDFTPAGGSLQLDIVGFLAILGEASVESTARISALSISFLLPRLLPAPQALIRASRPGGLAPASAKVVGIYSGDFRDHVNYIAHLLHDGDSLSPYSVRCEAITQKEDPPVKAKRWGPTTVLALIGCGMSCGLLGLSIHERDGMALLAVIFLSFLSTLVGFGCQWKLELPHRRAKRQVPPADVVINYPNGSFLIIKCNENVARALYWHPEECIYFRNTREYRLISLLGTLVLMFGVIFLGNARIKSQLGFAASYIILNAAYWIVAALPQRWNWDLRCYDAKTEHHSSREENETFTTALWKAIAISGTTKWVRNSPGLAPATEKWNLWLKEAQRVIDATPCEQDKNTRDFIFPRWDPEKYLTDVLGSEDTTIPDKTEASEDSMV